MANDFSRQSVKSLFRLDLKSRFGTTHRIGFKSRLMQMLNYLFTLLIYAVLVLGIYYLIKMFVDRSGLRMELLVMITTGTIILATIVATGNVIKNLYMDGDNELLLRFPVSGKEIYVAKSCYCFLHNVVICALIMLPFYMTYGAVTHANVSFYFGSVLIILLSSFMPFFIANIIAVPVMMLMNLMKNRFLLVLLFTVAAIVGVFIFYMEALGNVIEYMSTQNQTLFSADMIERYRQFAQFAYPFNWYAHLLGGYGCGLAAKDIGLAFLYIVLINVALGALSLFISTKAYYRTILYGIENSKSSFTRKTKNVKRTLFGTMLRREFFLIFRSFNYSFQYLAMAVAAPVMVYYCNNLASSMGTKSIGAEIVPGLTLMVIIIFVTIIVSFASTSISREGQEFYITKIIPVSYTKQVATKFFLYAIVGSAAVILSCLVCGLVYGTEKGGNLLSLTDIFSIFGISEMVVLSLTCLSMWADVKSPTFNVAGDGELVSANKNVAVSLTVGIALAVLYGMFTMVFSFLPLQIGDWNVVEYGNIGSIYLILTVITIVLMIVSFAVLFANIEKRYKKIVP